MVSVIMAVYNGEQYVAQAVQSVIDQTYSNWELLLINDGSEDRTRKIIRGFNDPRIRFFDTNNNGVSSARNLGLSNMKGEFFCFLDSDDVFPINSIKSRLKAFDDNVSFVDGRVDVYDASLSNRLWSWRPKKRGRVINELVRLNGKCFFGPTWMVRKNSKVRYSMCNELKHGEDLIFYVSIAQSGLYSFTDEKILSYRYHQDSAMRNIEGLANGYTEMKGILNRDFGDNFGLLNSFIFTFRSKKIVFLSFLREGKIRMAFSYLLFGKI